MTMLQRDIRDLASIAATTAIPRLLSVVAERAGWPLNFADLSRTTSLPQTTLKRCFALLEGTVLVLLLRPQSGLSAGRCGDWHRENYPASFLELGCR
jgi:hypothetical protein